MRITSLIAACTAALSLAAFAAPVSAATALQESPGNAGSYVMTAANDDLGLHDIGAASASVQLGSIDTAALGAAGHRASAPPI